MSARKGSSSRYAAKCRKAGCSTLSSLARHWPRWRRARNRRPRSWWPPIVLSTAVLWPGCRCSCRGSRWPLFVGRRNGGCVTKYYPVIPSARWPLTVGRQSMRSYGPIVAIRSTCRPVNRYSCRPATSPMSPRRSRSHLLRHCHHQRKSRLWSHCRRRQRNRNHRHHPQPRQCPL